MGFIYDIDSNRLYSAYGLEICRKRIFPTSWLRDQSAIGTWQWARRESLKKDEGKCNTPQPVHKKLPCSSQTLKFLNCFGPDATLNIS